DQLPEEHEAEITVDAPHPGLELGAFAVNPLVDELLGAAAGNEVEPSLALGADHVLEVWAPGWQARAMREEMAKRHMSLLVDAEVVEKPRHPIIERDLLLLHQDHECGRGGERLGERGQVEGGIRLHRGPLGLEAA